MFVSLDRNVTKGAVAYRTRGRGRAYIEYGESPTPAKKCSMIPSNSQIKLRMSGYRFNSNCAFFQVRYARRFVLICKAAGCLVDQSARNRGASVARLLGNQIVAAILRQIRTKQLRFDKNRRRGK